MSCGFRFNSSIRDTIFCNVRTFGTAGKVWWPWHGMSGVQIPIAVRIFLFSKFSGPAPEATQPPLRWVPLTSFPGADRTAALSSPLISIYCRGQEWVELYLCFPYALSRRGHGQLHLFARTRESRPLTAAPKTKFPPTRAASEDIIAYASVRCLHPST